MNINTDSTLKVGSVLQNENLNGSVSLTDEINGKEGEAVAVEVTSNTALSGQLELQNGMIAPVTRGEIVLGVLGKRKALEGAVGDVPSEVKPGDKLHILNLGGVIGKVDSWNQKTTTRPVEVKVLGGLRNGSGNVNIRKQITDTANTIDTSASMILISGTSMNTGKTTLATQVIEHLTDRHDKKVSGAKLTGVATQKDLNEMVQAGADEAKSFSDVGMTSTIDEDKEKLITAAKSILNGLGQGNTDVIVAELGDGIVGWYGVDTFISDDEFTDAIDLHMVCANDLAGALGSIRVCQDHDMSVDYFAGPVTNTSAGVEYLTSRLDVDAGQMDEHGIRDDSLKRLLSDHQIT